MNTLATRGAILIVAAVAIGAVVLGKGFDDDVPAGFEVSTDDSTASAPGDNSDDSSEEPADASDASDDGAGGETGDDGAAAGGETVVTPPATLSDPATVSVLVANAAGVNGAAGNATSKLIARNYNALPPTNAIDRLPATVIYYEPDFELDAGEVAQILGARPDQIEPMPGADPLGVPRAGVNVLVMLGEDDIAEPPPADDDVVTEGETDGDTDG